MVYAPAIYEHRQTVAGYTKQVDPIFLDVDLLVNEDYEKDFDFESDAKSEDEPVML